MPVVPALAIDPPGWLTVTCNGFRSITSRSARTEADYEAWRRQRDWTAWKDRMARPGAATAHIAARRDCALLLRRGSHQPHPKCSHPHRPSPDSRMKLTVQQASPFSEITASVPPFLRLPPPASISSCMATVSAVPPGQLSCPAVPASYPAPARWDNWRGFIRPASCPAACPGQMSLWLKHFRHFAPARAAPRGTTQLSRLSLAARRERGRTQRKTAFGSWSGNGCRRAFGSTHPEYDASGWGELRPGRHRGLRFSALGLQAQ
jgi:hypothetical protein